MLKELGYDGVGHISNASAGPGALGRLGSDREKLPTLPPRPWL
jgi:hypothetical protein